jgi:hypothetical protein
MLLSGASSGLRRRGGHSAPVAERGVERAAGVVADDDDLIDVGIVLGAGDQNFTVRLKGDAGGGEIPESRGDLSASAERRVEVARRGRGRSRRRKEHLDDHQPEDEAPL